VCESADRNGELHCWVLLGPTACGKSALAIELAERLGLEIVSVDSMQVYRGMDIGTAKPTRRQRARVPHHMIDVLDPQDPCSVGWFVRRAGAAIAEIRSRARRPLLVGGSPLYLKGILWGLADGPPRDPALRRRLQQEADDRGGPFLHERLAQLAPTFAARIHPNDVHRIVRSLEVWELTGRPPAEPVHSFNEAPRLAHVAVGLRRPRQELYARVDRRVEAMMAAGLLDEVRSLQGRLGPQARHALGYRELTAHLDGSCGLAGAVALMKRNTRRYAKHQLTWYRHFPQVRWLEVRGREDSPALVEQCRKLFRSLDTL
jgi:tRNA dimethylallyltransferase